jgi:hypothetical protein
METERGYLVVKVQKFQQAAEKRSRLCWRVIAVSEFNIHTVLLESSQGMLESRNLTR